MKFHLFYYHITVIQENLFINNKIKYIMLFINNKINSILQYLWFFFFETIKIQISRFNQVENLIKY